MPQSQIDFINSVRAQCRKIDQLEDAIQTLHQSSEDIPEILMNEYEQEYKYQLEILNNLLIP